MAPTFFSSNFQDMFFNYFIKNPQTISLDQYHFWYRWCVLCSIFIFFCFLSYFSPGKALLAGKGISRQVFLTPDGAASLLIHNGVKSFLKQHSCFHAPVLSQDIFETLSTKIFVLGGLFMKQHTHAHCAKVQKYEQSKICWSPIF